MKMNEWMNEWEGEWIDFTHFSRTFHLPYIHTHTHTTHIIFILFMHITRTPTHTTYTPIIYHSIHIDLINNSIRLILFYLCITNRIHIIKRSSSSHASHSLTHTHTNPSIIRTHIIRTHIQFVYQIKYIDLINNCIGLISFNLCVSCNRIHRKSTDITREDPPRVAPHPSSRRTVAPSTLIQPCNSYYLLIYNV